jgi:hypothetical protein
VIYIFFGISPCGSHGGQGISISRQRRETRTGLSYITVCSFCPEDRSNKLHPENRALKLPLSGNVFREPDCVLAAIWPQVPPKVLHRKKP